MKPQSILLDRSTVLDLKMGANCFRAQTDDDDDEENVTEPLLQGV